ncbi:MAG: ATP-binding cassette domain-containing protein, partial [Actinomycetia bacterium]|nr:ATP-binding cassette domain-containing protein [Actinomycetes bacterium]
MTSAILATGVSKSFGAVRALDDLQLDVPEGSFFVLLGPSGAGKTTTLRVVAGLEAPDAGSIHLTGIDATRATPAERDLAMVFQNYAL